jgi:hypothetical protein
MLVQFTIAIAASVASAQKPESPQSYGIFSTQTEYYQFMGSAKRAAASNPELKALIPLINDVVLNKPIGSTNQQYRGSASTLDLLADPEVQHDIEMADFQHREFQTLNAEIQKRMAEQLRSLDFAESENIVNRIRGFRDEAEQELDSVLLPHQVKRLQQLAIQTQLQRRSFVELLTNEPLKSRLKISESQSEELKKSAAEIEADLAREIAQLQAAARKKLLSRLAQTQQEQVEEIFGETFEFKEAINSRKGIKIKKLKGHEKEKLKEKLK